MSGSDHSKEHQQPSLPDVRLSRRSLLLGSAVAGAAIAGSGSLAARAAAEPAKAGASGEDVVDLARSVPFYGTDCEQAGIRTPPQRHILFMTFDLTTTDQQDLKVLLARWSAAIAQMMKGEPVGQVEPERDSAVGFDTGEALGLDPASLTVTVGLGPRIFGETFGLAGKKPPLMRALKALPSDAFRPELTGGDLSVQACADDQQVAYHAVRELARIAKQTGTATTGWTVMGFGRASAGPGQATPRNLLGFKDGTRNLFKDEDLDRFVFIKDGPEFQRHGTYQVVRKIEMRIESWDTDRVSDQNAVFGRHKVSGAPLGGTDEFDPPDFDKRGPDGEFVIPANCHVRLAAHETNGGFRILRRSYNYTDGINRFGLLDAGLLFISYQNDPASFEAIQQRLGAADALNEYIAHIGSGIFFVPPAPREGSYIGEALFMA